jgi:D-3-phosphoglycerate dehydrogenase
MKVSDTHTEKQKILACDGIDKAGIDLMREHFEVDERKKIEEDELIKLLSSGEYSALIVRSATKVSKKVLDSAKNLKVVGRAGIGVDNIDVKTATEKGIIVMNTLGAAITTAEHTIALIFSTARRIPQAHKSLKEGKWEKNKFVGRELSGKTIGIVGLGNIGKKVGEISKAIGMNVIFYDPYVDDQRFKKVDLDELLRQSDIITVHVPLSDKTKGMIGEKEFQKMKEGVIIINCARGGIIDEQALAKYVKEGKVWGAGIDVFEKEPPDPDNPLLHLDNVVVTPHLGASTIEGQRNVSVEIAQKIVKFLKYGIIQDAVNFFPIPEDKVQFFELGVKLASFLAQAYPFTIKEIKISTTIDETYIVRAGVAWGFAKNMFGEELATPLNSENIIKSKGILFGETVLKDGEAQFQVKVEISTSQGIFSIGGIVFQGEHRIIELNSMRVEAPAVGNIIFFENEDKPGVVGRIGTYLGERGVNIASIHLGREKPGGKAVALVNIDSVPSDDVIEGIRKIPNVLRATFVKI